MEKKISCYKLINDFVESEWFKSLNYDDYLISSCIDMLEYSYLHKVEPPLNVFNEGDWPWMKVWIKFKTIDTNTVYKVNRHI